jgi:hypothetical protein
MITSSAKKEKREKGCGCKPEECVESTYNTQKTINTERVKYCETSYSAAGDVKKWEKTYDGESNLLNRRKCMFMWTEGNFQRYRNTEITLGTELIQTTDLIKENVKSYIDWGSKLSTALKDIFKAVKDAKAKLGDLRQAACKLEGTKTDSCYQGEWTVLTGRTPSKCGEESKPPPDPPKDYPDKCAGINDKICDLICLPKALDKDINSIFKSSSEIIGIQVFSNIATLEPLQKAFADKSKAFDTHLQEVVKARESDMKKIQEALIKSVQERTKAASILYTSRSTFESLYDTTQYICCPKCDCVPENVKVCEPRLHDCECRICTICGQVKQTFCTGDDKKDQQQAD